MGEVRMKGENEGEEEEERRMKSKRERESVEHPCGGRQVSGCARFTLAFANGDTSRRKGESERLFSPRDEKRNEEEPRGELRKKEGRAGGEGGFAPKKRVTRHVIPALPLLFVAPGARTRYPGPGPVREDIQRSAGREHTHLRWAEQRYITRAPRDTSPADSLPLSSVSPSAGLSTSLFLSPFLSRSQKRVVSARVSSWVDRSPRLRPQLRNKVRVRGGANSSPWRS